VAATEAPAEERKLVTVLFADVSGSTELGERLDPERLRALLREFFAAMAGAIESWGGTVEKYIGDAVMAVFGIPRVHEDDPDRALRAALDMLERLEAVNASFRERHGVTLSVRIGVNSGEVIAPVGGSGREQIVAGDAVNVAARLEQAAEPGHVLVGERTYLATRDRFRFEAPEPLRLKGKSGVVVARRLVGPRPEAAPEQSLAQAPLVGREREQATLRSLYDEAVEHGQPRLAVLIGSAGIGKSRLVVEFVRGLGTGEGGPRVLRGRCLPAGEGITYWALGEILRAACGIGLDEPASVAAAKLLGNVEGILGPLAMRDEELDLATFALATTAGIHLPEDPLDRMEPREVAELLGRAWPQFATGLAAAGPAVLIVEDLHWAGDQLIEMLSRIVSRARGPLLVLATARPEFSQQHPDLAGREDTLTVPLRPLSQEQSSRLVDALVESTGLPSRVRGQVLDRAEGNPFFLEEIVRRLIDEGALAREGDGWRATEAADTIELPDTIHGLLAARIDVLPPPEKRLLQEASVVGRIFWPGAIARAGGAPDSGEMLLALEGRGMLVARPTSSIAGEAEYSFRHALLRDVAYAALPRTRRARAHAEVGAWLRELAGARVDEFGELIAHHLRSAVAEEDADLAWSGAEVEREAVRRQAVEALLAAGTSARRRSALGRAGELHAQALELADGAPERARALEALGEDADASFRGVEAVERYEEALDEATEAMPEVRARLLMKLARVQLNKGGTFPVRPGPERVEALLGEALTLRPDAETRAWLLTLQGDAGWLWRRANQDDPWPLERRLERAREASLLAGEGGWVQLQADAIGTLSTLAVIAGRYDESLSYLRKRLTLLAHTPPSTRHGVLLDTAVTIIDFEGGLQEAERLLAQAGELSADLSRHERLHVSGVQQHLDYLSGRWDAVEARLDAHRAGLREEGEVSCGLALFGVVAGILVASHRGERARARELADALPAAGVTPDAGWIPALLARAALELEGPEEAAAMARTGLGAVRGIRSRWTRCALVEALTRMRDWPALEAAMDEAEGLEGADIELRLAVQRGRALILLARGDRAGARTMLEAALAFSETSGLVLQAAWTLELLAELEQGPARDALLDRALATYEQLRVEPALMRIAAARDGETPPESRPSMGAGREPASGALPPDNASL
jgi:class 3 adenylate cyclase/tetratricopeptide (TPR) repeat protein